MAKFKNKDLLVLQDEELLLGNAQEASIKYDGSDLVINKVPYHTSEGYLATQQFVNDALLGLDWQNSVLSKTTDIPGGPTEGDRYIIPSGASGAWSGLDDTVAEYDTTWVYTTPSAGFTLWVEDAGVYYTHSGSVWVKMGTVVDHSNLLNLDVDDHTQYLNTTRHDLTARHGSSVVDHGGIGGLDDDDHSIYLTTGRHDTTDRHGSGVVSHSDIADLDADDHTQYLPITGGRAMTGDLDLDSYNLTTTGYISAGIFYGDGSNLIGMDHGDLTGLADDDHIQYLHTDGRRPWDGTLTVASTGSQIQFTEDFAYIGVSSNTDLLTLSPTGMIVDGNISATTFGGTGFDHDLITNTHDLTTDIDHDTITNSHNLSGDIDHDTLTNTHDLTSDIDHNTITNAHNLNVDIDHGSISGLDDDDHTQYFLNDAATNLTTTGYVSAATLYGDGSNVEGVLKNVLEDTTPQLGGDLDLNGKCIDFGAILTGDGTYEGTKMTVVVDDGAAVFGSVLAQAADFHYDLADADTAGQSVGLVMALEAADGSKEVLIEGQICETDWDWDAGLLYLSATAGDMTQTAPAGAGNQVVVVGWALSADTIYFKPSLVLVEVAA